MGKFIMNDFNSERGEKALEESLRKSFARPKDHPIENYGIIGNLLTAALVGIDGSIDWLCFPHFDSPSVFGALLDREKGGYFKIAPLGEFKKKQLYRPDTNVLVTRFLHTDGVGEITDFMSMGMRREPDQSTEACQIVRMVRVVRGELKFRLECFPAFDYARKDHKIHLQPEGAIFEADDMVFALHSDVPLTIQGSGVSSEFSLRAGEAQFFFIRGVEESPSRDLCKLQCEAVDLFARTCDYWRVWLSQSNYRGRWREKRVTRTFGSFQRQGCDS